MTPRYSLTIKRSCQREMRSLPTDVLRSVHQAIQSLRDGPRPRGCRRIRGRDDAWRVVVRKHYRILYVVDDDARHVEVYSVRRREKDTYR